MHCEKCVSLILRVSYGRFCTKEIRRKFYLTVQEEIFMEKETEKQKLGSGSIPGLMIKLAVPTIIAQLVNLLYNLVDRIYIGHIREVGDIALTGLG